MINTIEDIKATEILADTLKIVLDNFQANLHTQTIAKVVKVNADTVDVQPVINRVVGDKVIELPVFIEVPPIFLMGGQSHIAMPISIGDYCLLFFTERCFDRWYNGDDMQPPLELRMHNYSDGFALIGVAPRDVAIAIPQRITTIGDHDQTGDYVHIGSMTRTGALNQTGDVTINGNMTQTGDYSVTGDVVITGNLTIGGIRFDAHTHSQAPDSAGNTEQDTGTAQ